MKVCCRKWFSVGVALVIVSGGLTLIPGGVHSLRHSARVGGVIGSSTLQPSVNSPRPPIAAKTTVEGFAPETTWPAASFLASEPEIEKNEEPQQQQQEEDDQLDETVFAQKFLLSTFSGYLCADRKTRNSVFLENAKYREAKKPKSGGKVVRFFRWLKGGLQHAATYLPGACRSAMRSLMASHHSALWRVGEPLIIYYCNAVQQHFALEAQHINAVCNVVNPQKQPGGSTS